MLRIARDCAAKGHQVTIYTGQWRGDYPDGAINVVIVPQQGWLNHQRHQSLIDGMHARLAIDQPDIIVGFNRMPGLDVYYAADPCFKARAYEDRSWWYRLSGRYRFFADSEEAVMRADGTCRILTLAPGEKTLFQHWYRTPDRRFYQLPPNIPHTRFAGVDRVEARDSVRREFGLPDGAWLILFVGSAFVRKGLDRIILGLAALPEHLKQTTYILAVGEDKADAMHALAKANGLERQVIICDDGRSDVPRLMLAADMLAHPARSELAGLVITEALTAGLPVLVTENCGYAFHVRNASAGVVLPRPFRQQDMDAALLSMLDSDRLRAFGQAGQHYAQEIADSTSGSYEADLIESFAYENISSRKAGQHVT